MEMASTVLEHSHAYARLVISLHTHEDPLQAEWEQMMAQLGSLLSAAPDTRSVRILVVTGGGGPNAKQRAQLREVYGKREILTAVVVPGRGNALKRGLMTALSWMNPAIAFFTPDQFDGALAHLAQTDRSAVWNELRGLQAQLAAVPTLRSIAQANQLPAIATHG